MSLFAYGDVLHKEAIVANMPLAGADECVRHGAGYRNKFAARRLVQNLHPELNTYNELFRTAVQLFGPRPCLAHREYDYGRQRSCSRFTSMSYADVDDLRMAYGAGILYCLRRNRFRSTPEHRKIGSHADTWNKFSLDCHSFVLTIYAGNRYEWVLTDLACVAYSITNTALYDTLGRDSTTYILNLTKSPIVVCSADKLDALLAMRARGDVPELICVVSLDPVSHADTNHFYHHRIELLYVHDVIAKGRLHRLAEMPPSADTIYTISFTSGTTARPKGVVLQHRQAVCGNTFLVSTCAQIPNGRAFVFLPLAHIYERQTSAFALSTGYCLGFPKLDRTADALADLVDDLRIFKPHYVSLVPRLLVKLEALVKTHVARLDNFKVNQIIQYKQANQSVVDGYPSKDMLDSYGPYADIRSLVGFDNMCWVNTASAPISASTIRYIKSSLNIGLRQMYGLTETFGAMTTTSPYDSKPGSSGIMAICGEFKLRPAMDYDGGDRGELLMRGPNVFPRYYKNERATTEAIDADGWFSTGDIAHVGPKGEITIIDRVKNFFKLSQGEYVSPERLENRYLSSNPNLTQLFVHGDSTQAYLVAVAGVAGDVPTSRSDKAQLLQQLNQNVGDLNGFEYIRNVHVAVNPLADVLTPTFKLKRREATAKFRAVLDRLYLEGPLDEPKSKL